MITLQITDRQERAREKENAAEEMRRTRTAIEVEVLHFARQAFAIGGAFAKQGRTPTWRTAIWLSFFPAEPVLFNALAGRIGVYEPEKVRRLVGFYLGMQRIRARRLAWHAFPHDEPPPNAEYTTLYILVEHALQAAAKLLESLQVDEQPEPGKSLLSLLNETAESLRSQRQR